MNRRKFLQQAALCSAGLLIPVGINSWISYGASKNLSQERLIVIMLRGGIDGLNVLVPYTDEDYYFNRLSIALNPPGESNGVIDLDGNFGLHPALQDLMPLWQEKSLAFVNCCGLTNSNRSHFNVQYFMETGTPGDNNNSEGWMNRLLGIIHQNNNITQAVSLGSVTPRIFSGSNSVTNLPRGKRSKHQLSTNNDSQLDQAFIQLYSGQNEVSRMYREGEQSRKILLQELEKEMIMASKGAPNSDKFVKEAREIATLMKGNANTQLAYMDFGGWDTHINESNALKRLLPPLGKGLAALRRELGNEYNNTTIVVLSEFGRTVKENGNRGTEHGHGNAMWILGGKIKGGKIYGEWSGLDKSKLHQGRDLPIKTDYREIISYILQKKFQLSSDSLNQVFPRFNYQPKLSFI